MGQAGGLWRLCARHDLSGQRLPQGRRCAAKHQYCGRMVRAGGQEGRPRGAARAWDALREGLSRPARPGRCPPAADTRGWRRALRSSRTASAAPRLPACRRVNAR